MKQLLIIMLTMFSLNFVYAQSHNPGPNSNCKLNKNYSPNIEKISCPACDLNDKKEKVAKVAEDKRRSDIIVAKAKSEKEALDKAYKDKLALDAKKAETGKVYINGNNNVTVSKTQIKDKKIPIKNPNALYMWPNQNNGFMNAITRIPIPKTTDYNYAAAEGCFTQREGVEISIKEKYSICQSSFPANTGIIRLDIIVNQENHPLNFSNSPANYTVHDIVNEEQKRLFNSNTICFITHLYGDWFFIGYNYVKAFYSNLYFESAKLYNLKSKEYIVIRERDFLNQIYLVGTEKNYAEKNIKINSYFVLGIYQKYNYTRNTYEVLIDNKVGGPDKWKAFFAVSLASSKNDRNAMATIYYCDETDKIKTTTISQYELKTALRN